MTGTPPATRPRRAGQDRALVSIARQIKNALFHHAHSEAVAIRLYFCEAVMALTAHLRHHTRAATLAAQHEALKAAFKYLAFGRNDRADLHIFDIEF